MDSMSNNIGRTSTLGLCISCELCVVVCPEDAVEMAVHGGQFVPIVDTKKCSECGMCTEICPGLRLDPHGLISRGFLEEADYAGGSLECKTAKLKDRKLLAETTSGGVVTGMLLELLAHGIYDSAFILDQVGSPLTVPRLRLTSDAEDVIAAVKSKYTPVSAFDVAQTLKTLGGKRLVITATPCVLDSIICYARLTGISLESVLLIGLFCDLTMNLNFIDFIERTHGGKDEFIELLDYRSKSTEGWPGHMRITFAGGRTTTVDNSVRMRLKPYFRLKRCLLCTDKFNRAADISVGDCYLRGWADKEGRSSVIIRTEKGRAAFYDCTNAFETWPSDMRSVALSQGIDKLLNKASDFIALKEQFVSIGKPRVNPPNLDKILGKKELERIAWGKEMKVSRILSDIRVQNVKTSAGRALKRVSTALILFSRVLADAPSLLFKTDKASTCSTGNAIGILGANSQNRGAQAMALTVIDKLRTDNPDAGVVLLLHNYLEEKDRWNQFRVDLLPWDIYVQLLLLCPRRTRMPLARLFGSTELCRALGDYRRIGKFIDVSGYALSSRFGLMTTIGYIANIMVAKKLRCDIELLPQSFGPWRYPSFAKPFLGCLLKLYLRYPTRIIAREKESEAYIREFSGNAEFSYDLVLFSRGYRAQNILKPGVDIQEPELDEDLVGIIPNTKVLERMNRNTFFSMYDEAVDFLDQHGLSVVLLWYSDEDRILCDEILKRNEENSSLKGVLPGMNTLEAELAIRHFKFVISSRYHAIIHAYRNSVPALVIGWAHKYDSLLEAFGQTDFLIRSDNAITDDTIRSSLTRMIDRYDKEKIVITEALESIREASLF